MKCPKCGRVVRVESVDGKTKKIVCAKCGYTEVVDDQGRGLLLS